MVELNEKQKIARSMICLPLDGLNSLDEVKAMVEELSPYVGLFKIGKESFTRFGPEIVKMVQDGGSEVFLDLKYHDIPNTVKGAAKAAAEMGVYMFNVHASGGKRMMEAALEGVAGFEKKPLVIAVTILTSIDKECLNNEIGIVGDVADQVLKLAKLTEDAGLDGVVCSAADLFAVHDKVREGFMFVTPGIKGTSTPAGEDQKRVFTPGNAVKAGSTVLVIGRAITGADDRTKAAMEVIDDMVKEL